MQLEKSRDTEDNNFSIKFDTLGILNSELHLGQSLDNTSSCDTSTKIRKF